MSRGRDVAVPELPPVEVVLRRIGKNRGNSQAIDLAHFVLALGRLWKERGGTVAGKPRHSDRHLNELLKQRGTIVKSLTPKLAGKTKLKPDDATALLRLFLSHWNYVSPSESSIQSDTYLDSGSGRAGFCRSSCKLAIFECRSIGVEIQSSEAF